MLPICDLDAQVSSAQARRSPEARVSRMTHKGAQANRSQSATSRSTSGPIFSSTWAW